ncbi:MAG: 4-(cytidine 5'-diphospho)-2-C-methyl-D-erythritol kinase [Longimicrobiales bacterium]
MTEVRVRAPAKVNLALRILGRRPSGFHDLETVFQAVDLCDDLVVRTRTAPGVGLVVHGADVGPPADNLVVRAAEAFLAAAGGEGGVEVELTKRIPAGAGLGGGSSHAGATLRALDALWPGAVAGPALRAIAADLGSDVPFFLGEAGRALGRGRGEVLTPLAPLPPAVLVLGLPPVHVATGPAYGALARARAAGGGRVPPPLYRRDAGDVPTDWAGVAAGAVNDFEATVTASSPPVARALAALRDAEPRFALLSGSGAAVFAVYDDEAAAERRRGRAAAACPDTTFVTATTLARMPGLNGPGAPV